VWKLGRLACSLKEGGNVLADWCQRGMRIIAITQQSDLSGPVGYLIARRLFGIAEIELQHAKERQAAGIAVAKQRGVYTGRQRGTTKAAPARASLAQARAHRAGNCQGPRREGMHCLCLPEGHKDIGCIPRQPVRDGLKGYGGIPLYAYATL
jgi:DNA invertase Pin-like site-specific DNA recombinase